MPSKNDYSKTLPLSPVVPEKRQKREYNRKNKNRRQMRIATNIFVHSNFQNQKV